MANFPEPIIKLPQAVIPLEGVTAFLSQSPDHQIVFMEFAEDVDLPEHRNSAQWESYWRVKSNGSLMGSPTGLQKATVTLFRMGLTIPAKYSQGTAILLFLIKRIGIISKLWLVNKIINNIKA